MLYATEKNPGACVMTSSPAQIIQQACCAARGELVRNKVIVNPLSSQIAETFRYFLKTSKQIFKDSVPRDPNQSRGRYLRFPIFSCLKPKTNY